MQQKTQHKRKKETVAVNSRLIRRPIQRCFAIFLLPTFAAFCIGFLWPFVKGLYLSFCTFTTTSNAKWVGLQNYQKALTDASFLHAFWYTALVAIVSLILINVLSFAVAYALTRKIPGANIYRGVFFMPNLIGGIVLGYIWQRIFNGILPTAIVLNTHYGFWGLIVLMCWQQVGYMMIIYIAGLQSVSEDMLEAARIDGANGWNIFWKITLPMLTPTLFFLVVTHYISYIQMFDAAYIMTEGGPGHATRSFVMQIYNTAFEYFRMGEASAYAWVLFIAVMIITVIQFKVQDKWVNYDA